MEKQESMQDFTYVVNIGNQKMTNYLSYTLLLPFIDKKNVFLYYFKIEFNKSLEDKLNEIFVDIKNMTLETTNQTFKIIYYNSNYNTLLEEDLSKDSTNSLLYFTKLLDKKIQEYQPLIKKFDEFEHIHIFHEPWFSDDVISKHQKIVSDDVKPFLDKHNKKYKLNRHFVYRFSQLRNNPRQLAFDLMSLKSMHYVVQVLSNNLNSYETCAIKNSMCNQEIEDISIQYDNYLPKYKGKLVNYLDYLKTKDPKVTLSLYDDSTQFWTLKTYSDSKIDKISNDSINSIICSDSSKKGCFIDYKTFIRRWDMVKEDIDNRVISEIKEQQKEKYSFNKKENEINSTKDPFVDITNKPRREILEDLIINYRKLLNFELKKSFSANYDDYTKETSNRLSNILAEFKWKFGELLQKFPSNRSIYFLFISLGMIVLFATFLLLYIFNIEFLQIFNLEGSEWEMILGTSILVASILYGVFFILGAVWIGWYYFKYRTYLSSLRREIEKIFIDYREKIIKRNKEELKSYNLRVLYKENLDIIRKEIVKFKLKDKILQNKKNNIASLLDLGVLRTIKEDKTVNTKFDKEKDFQRIIEFEIFNKKNNSNGLD